MTTVSPDRLPQMYPARKYALCYPCWVEAYRPVSYRLQLTLLSIVLCFFLPEVFVDNAAWSSDLLHPATPTNECRLRHGHAKIACHGKVCSALLLRLRPSRDPRSALPSDVSNGLCCRCYRGNCREGSFHNLFPPPERLASSQVMSHPGSPVDYTLSLVIRPPLCGSTGEPTKPSRVSKDITPMLCAPPSTVTRPISTSCTPYSRW